MKVKTRVALITVCCFLSACKTSEGTQENITNPTKSKSEIAQPVSKKTDQQKLELVSKITEIKAKKIRVEQKMDVKMVTIQGTIIYLNFEGGFYGIVTKNGQKLLPMNLTKEFKKVGAVVKVKGELMSRMMTIQQWGTPFKISHIEIIKAADIDPNSF